MRIKVLWGGALSLIALGGSLLGLHGCGRRTNADSSIISKRAALELEDLRSEKVADAGGTPLEPAGPDAPKESTFIIRLASLELDEGAKLTGSVAGIFTADLYRLLWIDSAGRVLGAYELHSVSREKKTNAVIFDIARPLGCSGAKHKLVLISTSKEAIEKAGKAQKEPPYRVEGEIEFHVAAPAAGWKDYVVAVGGDQEQAKLAQDFGLNARRIGELISADAQPLCLPGNWAERAAEYAKTRDAKAFVRQPSIFDDAALARAETAIAASLNEKGGELIGWTLGKSLSLTHGACPFDFDMSRETLGVYREWLEERYGSIQALNRQWGTRYINWSDVVPPATDAVKAAHNPVYAERLAALTAGGETPWEERGGVAGFQMEFQEFHAPGQENFSAWSDFREFNNFAFARVLREQRKSLRDLAPAPLPAENGQNAGEIRAGICGVQQPSAFGGWEPWQLSRSVDWINGCESVVSREMIRSFAPKLPCLTSLSENCGRYQLWDGFLRGDMGASVNSNAMFVANETQPEKDQALRADLRQLSGGLTALRQSALSARDAVAIYYSPRSIQLHWMLDSEGDGSFWLGRDAAYEAAHSSALLQLNAWLLLLEDLGYSPQFIHPEQAAGGQLQKLKIKAVILPKVLALSRAEANALQEFARAGGLVIADGQCGTFDEHGKRREPLATALGRGMARKNAPQPIGILDQAFGIARKDLQALELNGDFHGDESARVTMKDPASGDAMGPESDELRLLEPGVVTAGAWSNGYTAPGAAALVTKRGGLGRFIYLNLSMQDYAQRRGEPLDDTFQFHGISAAEYLKKYGAPSGGEALRILVGDMLSEVLPENPLRVLAQDGTPLRGIKRARYYLGKDCAIFGLLPIGVVEKQGGDTVVGGQTISAETPAWAAMSKPRHWYDIRQGKYIGNGPSVGITMHPDQATLLAALPYKVERISLRIRRTDARGVYKISGGLVADTDAFGRHLLRVEIKDPQGRTMPGHTRDIITGDGTFALDTALGLNEAAGRYVLAIRDLVTGNYAEGDLLKDTSEYTQLPPLTLSPLPR